MTSQIDHNGKKPGELGYVQMVNYSTPLGMFADWEAAAAACERADLDPCTCIEIRPIEYRDVCVEHAYGSAYRISNPVRVF